MRKHLCTYIIMAFIGSCAPIFAQTDSTSLLTAPEGWRPELMPFPLSFAPSLDYKGVEDIRFAPGWSDEESNEFWTYSFLWYLDDDPKLSPKKLQQDFEIYFDGLMSVVGKDKDIAAREIIKTRASFKSNGANGFQGVVNIYDAFFSRQQIELNFDLEESFCEKTGKHLTLFRISPQKYDNDIWNSLQRVQLGIDCQ